MTSGGSHGFGCGHIEIILITRVNLVNRLLLVQPSSPWLKLVK